MILMTYVYMSCVKAIYFLYGDSFKNSLISHLTNALNCKDFQQTNKNVKTK